MRERIRNGAAIVIAGLYLALAIPTLFAVPRVTGVTLGYEDSVLSIVAVDPEYYLGYDLRPGMVVTEVDRTPVAAIPPQRMEEYLQGYFTEFRADHPQYPNYAWSTPPEMGSPSEFEFLVGVGLLLGIATWVRRGQAGEVLRPFALPLAVASVPSLILRPAWPFLSWPLAAVGLALSTLALLVLADGFAEGITRPVARRIAAAVAVGAAIGCASYAIYELGGPWTGVLADHGLAMVGLPAVLAAGVTLVPAVALVLSSRPRQPIAPPFLLAAITPTLIATSHGITYWSSGLTIPLLWLLVVAFLLQTNARAETMRVQRDTVVAAAERERARLAADLHDDALQEMTVLVRQLDDAGDEASAVLARSVAERLREVCGELRLPVLDELGAGAALEWLVDRVGETSGGQVRLEREDRARPPADVELAVFRVAQEALSNAVTHGSPPILVRYAAAADRASLSVTDQGVGIAADAASKAARSGHYGLLNMRQRAEQIGAKIDVRRPPGGGTSIGLSWSSA